MEIPRDVWLYLAQFIPDDDLRKMITLNSAFFDLGMNARYRDVRLHFLGEQEIKHLVRLMQVTDLSVPTSAELCSRDPAVAKRIRSFSIDPHIDSSLTGISKNNSGDNGDGHSRQKFWRRGVDVLKKRVRDRQQQGHQEESIQQYSLTLEGLEHALVDAVSGWSNLREFSARWWDSAQLQQLESFLPTAWSTFGPSLRKVTLAGSTASLRTLVSAAQRLPSLRDLCFEITHDILRADDVADMATLADVIAPFINSVGPTLENLSVSSWGASVDLSEFFLKLGSFPRLRHFTARAPFNKAFSINADGFTRLLRDHSHSLTSVTLRLNPSGSMIDPTKEESLCRWMVSANSDPLILANLNTMEMYPTRQPSGFEAFLALLGRSADTLTALAVRDRYLTYGEVESITSTFKSRPATLRLTTLCLNVRVLSLHLIDLLARELPWLLKLSLYAGETWRDGGAGEHGEATRVRNPLSKAA